MDGRLRRVDDKVSQREAEALRGSAQAQRLGSRPGKGLLLWAGGGRGRRLTLVTSILLFSLEEVDKQDVTDDTQMLAPSSSFFWLQRHATRGRENSENT